MLTAIPAAITRSTPQKIESPIPARGPIRLDFTALIDAVSKSGFSLFSFSIEATSPIINVENGTVVLKYDILLESASFFFSGSL